jgi:hypothetical protein
MLKHSTFFHIMIVQIKEIKFYRIVPIEIQNFVRILSLLCPRNIWESGFSNRILYGNIDIVQRRGNWYMNAIEITTSTILTTEMFKKVKDLL